MSWLALSDLSMNEAAMDNGCPPVFLTWAPTAAGMGQPLAVWTGAASEQKRHNEGCAGPEASPLTLINNDKLGGRELQQGFFHQQGIAGRNLIEPPGAQRFTIAQTRRACEEERGTCRRSVVCCH